MVITTFYQKNNFQNHSKLQINATISNMLNFGVGFSMFMSNSNQQQSVPFTVHISVTDRLDLKVAGHADLKGAWIEAGELHAAFNSLMMESMYSISKYHQWGASLGFDTADLSGSLGGNIKNGERHVIEQITTLLGHNSAVVIVTKALELNGAMIAAAQRNPDGTFTDHGQLTLNFGEIFLKHLHGYDDGITLGAAINLKGHLQDDNFVKRFTFGMHKEEHTVYATVGQGPGEIPGANRDVNQAVKNRVKINIDPINAYFSNYDFAAAHEKIKQGLKRRGARFILRTAEGIFNTIVDPLHELYTRLTRPSPESELEPEESEENPMPNEEEPEEKPKKEVKPKKKQETKKEKAKEQAATEEDFSGKTTPWIMDQYTENMLDVSLELDRMGLSKEVKQKVLEEYKQLATFDLATQKQILEHLSKPAPQEKSIWQRIWQGMFGVPEAHACGHPATCAAIGVTVGVSEILAAAIAAITAKKVIDETLKHSHPKQSFSSSSSSSGMPDPNDWEPDDDKFKWEVKSHNDADKIMRHEKFGKFYRDPTQRIGNKEIWWTKDNAHHADTQYKLYIKRNNYFEHFADLDDNGLQILKYKGRIGAKIPIKDFSGVK